jgi:hypothetical protein
VLELLAGFPCCEHESHRLGQEPPSDEGERQRRRLIQALRVVHDAEQRAMLGGFRYETQRGEANQESVRRRSCCQAEDDPKRVSLGNGQPIEPAEQRRAQLMQAREGQLHLGLDTRRSCDAQVGNGIDETLQQCRLPDPGLAPQHQRTTLAPADRGNQLVQKHALVLTACQARPTGQGRRPWPFGHSTAARKCAQRPSSADRTRPQRESTLEPPSVGT